MILIFVFKNKVKLGKFFSKSINIFRFKGVIMKKLLILLLLVAVIGCTSTQLKKDSTITDKKDKEYIEPEAGDVRVFDGIEFVYIPYGTFAMGLRAGMESERPVHKVTITEGFWLSKYEITQKQWENVMGKNPSCFKGENHPVENVSWNDVQDFIKNLNNEKYRLPTEAEWEYASRAGSTSKFFFGNDKSLLFDYCWYGEDIRKGSTHPVGQKKPNPWGLHDIYGNVYEYCQDNYNFLENYYSQSPELDPSGPAVGKYKVMRGGSWGAIARYCNSGNRNSMDPSKGSFNIGFRLLREE